MTHNPADPRDPRHDFHAAKPVWETFEIAVEGKRPIEHAHRVERLLKGVRGMKKVAPHLDEERVTITYDARITNPAAIHEMLLQRGYKAAAHVK
ncbi:MAG: heavy-metal-associated domain-containing protein [Chthoniobacterales bacterium]